MSFGLDQQENQTKVSLVQGWEGGRRNLSARFVHGLFVHSFSSGLSSRSFLHSSAALVGRDAHSDFRPQVEGVACALGAQPADLHRCPWDPRAVAPNGHLPGHHQDSWSFPGLDTDYPQPHRLSGRVVLSASHASWSRFYLNWAEPECVIVDCYV